MKRLFFSLAITLAGSSAFAHDGPRVWIGNDSGTIRTYTSDDDLEPSVCRSGGCGFEPRRSR